MSASTASPGGGGSRCSSSSCRATASRTPARGPAGAGLYGTPIEPDQNRSRRRRASSSIPCSRCLRKARTKSSAQARSTPRATHTCIRDRISYGASRRVPPTLRLSSSGELDRSAANATSRRCGEPPKTSDMPWRKARAAVICGPSMSSAPATRAAMSRANSLRLAVVTRGDVCVCVCVCVCALPPTVSSSESLSSTGTDADAGGSSSLSLYEKVMPMASSELSSARAMAAHVDATAGSSCASADAPTSERRPDTMHAKAVDRWCPVGVRVLAAMPDMKPASHAHRAGVATAASRGGSEQP